MRTCKICFIILLAFLSWNCSSKPDISGKWSGTATENKHGRKQTLNLDLLLSQDEKNINGSLTLALPNNPQNVTYKMQGFIEGETVSLNGEARSLFGIAVPMNIQGSLSGNRINGKLSLSGETGVGPLDMELAKVN